MQLADRYRRLCLVCALLIAAVATACAGTAVAPEHPTSTAPADTENVGIVVSEDEIVLSGHMFGAQNDVLVILSHMVRSDQTAWFDTARKLAANGYAAFTYDFRGYGDSEGGQDYDKLDDDLSAVVRYMEARGKHKIFLVGASMGGTASLVVAAQQDVAGVVTISAPSEFAEQDALAAVPRITAPKLFIASEDDTAVMISMQELLEASGAPKESQTYSGDAHGTDLLQPDKSEHVAAVQERILQFLRDYGGP
jgi:pimeloyl-ACP methyl ester carboxylesterase